MSSQQNVLRRMFKQLGISNHLQASYYNMLGKEVISSHKGEYNAFFPIIKGKGKSEEWNTAFSLVLAYVKEKKMDLTAEIASRFVNVPVEDSRTIGARYGCTREGRSAISNLVHDQRMVTALNCRDLDYDLPISYYALPK